MAAVTAPAQAAPDAASPAVGDAIDKKSPPGEPSAPAAAVAATGDGGTPEYTVVSRFRWVPPHALRGERRRACVICTRLILPGEPQRRHRRRVGVAAAPLWAVLRRWRVVLRVLTEALVRALTETHVRPLTGPDARDTRFNLLP
jgi:hypothetical protein